MVRSLWTAASGMIAQQENVDTIAHNMANINTTGYKTETAEFKTLLYQTLQSRSTNNAGDQKPISAQVGLGTRTASVTSHFTQGNLIDTDSPFAVAMEGDGFFKVRTINGQIQYTRDGNFTVSPVDGGNLLCTSDGDPVLDQNNNTIIIPNTMNTVDENGQAVVRRINASDISIAQDGTIAMSADGGNTYNNMIRTDANGNALYTVQIGRVQFNNPTGLEKVSGNKYVETIASGAAMEETQNVNLVQSKIHQGRTEASNVQISQEMVNLIVAQRAYEMNSKVIQTSDTMLEQANNLRR